MKLRARWLRWLLGLVAAFSLVVAALLAKADHIALGAQAYIFGYPLVIMDLTRRNAAAVIGPENHLRRVREFPSASFKEVVRPNVDTLYTTAFIDMALGPWVFEMPANTERYEVMPFMDAWSNVFAAPGTRSTGTAGGRYLLVGPGWQGTLPQGLQLLRAPTQLVWLIGRTQTNGAADYGLVHRLQDGLALRSLADWAADQPPTQPAWQPSAVRPLPPAVQMQAMSTETFFEQLAMLMVRNPPAPQDRGMLAELARLGVTPGQSIQWGPTDRWALSLGRWIADFKITQALSRPPELQRGWSTPPANLGAYGTDYNTRAAVAMVGLGANLPADAIYPQTSVDASGQALNGAHRYRLHFAAKDLPPAQAFWSVTAYGADNFLMDHPIGRHAVGDRDALRYNTDGSLDLWVQAQAPAAADLGNWLPVQADQAFILNARLYWPKPAALEMRWSMPAVERVD
jgi:hypothetical protein